MTTAQQLTTAEELFNLPANGKRRELVRGAVIEKPPAGGEHGATTVNLTVPLAQFVKARPLGVVFAAETGFIIARDPDTVRAPDIAFVSRDRIPASGPPKKFFLGAPDLAVEVLSPSDTVEQVEDKVNDWLTAGARLVWVVNPRRGTVTIYRPGPQLRVAQGAEILSGEDVLPGFEIKLSELFT